MKKKQDYFFIFFRLALFCICFFFKFFFINLIYSGILQEHNPYFLALSRKPIQTISAFGKHEKWRFGASIFFIQFVIFFVFSFVFFYFFTSLLFLGSI